MKLKKLMAGVMVGIMAFSMAACSGGSAETEGPETQQQSDASGESKTVGISMPTQSLERWNRDGSYLKQQFESKGYTVELTYSDNKIDQQVKDIEGLIAGEIDLLVIAAIDGQALSQVLKDEIGRAHV